MLYAVKHITMCTIKMQSFHAFYIFFKNPYAIWEGTDLRLNASENKINGLCPNAIQLAKKEFCVFPFFLWCASCTRNCSRGLGDSLEQILGRGEERTVLLHNCNSACTALDFSQWDGLRVICSSLAISFWGNYGRS